MLTMPEDQAFVCHKDVKSALEGEIKDGCLTLKYTEFGPDRDPDYWKSYLFSAEQTAKLFGTLRLQSFINLCCRSGEDGLKRFLKNHGIEYTVRDWLDEWMETLPEEAQQEPEDPAPRYYWDNVDSSLYCLRGGPYEYSAAAHDWVWSEAAAGILIGEGFASPIDESEVQGYIDLLEEMYGKE